MRVHSKWLSAVGAAILVAGMFINIDCAYAWEDDVHYGLTKRLAIKAGISEADAEEIANADQKVDSSWFTGPMHITIAAACVGSEALGSRTVHDNHFASQVDPPKDPAFRIVIPDKVWLRGTAITIPMPSTRSSHTSLGADLHVFQDTWSHQGFPPSLKPTMPARELTLRTAWTPASASATSSKRT